MKLSTATFFLLIFCLFSCQSTQESSSDSAQKDAGSKADPVLWVSYTGTEGPGVGKHIVLVSGDEEYRSEEALPQLGKILATQHGFTCTVLFAQDPAELGKVDPNYVNNIPGLEALAEADLMVMFTRFRELPDDQMMHIQNYLMGGKPVIGIRTATHAFNILDSGSKWLHYSNGYKGPNEAWTDGFGRLVLGEKWISHHGHHKHQSTRGIVAEGADTHPITNGIESGDIWGPTDVYGVRLPLPDDSQPIILGQVINRAGEFDENDPLFGMRPTDSEIAGVDPEEPEDGNPNEPMMPVAWTKSYQLPGGQSGKAFAATIGAATDMLSEGVRRMYVNAVFWLLEMDVPEKASAEVVGPYNPRPYSFHKDKHFDDLNMQVSDHLME
ncbi:MAG: ThuA domain-containing protein [Bacteroidota bacterium]